jgi:hypothetical protein
MRVLAESHDAKANRWLCRSESDAPEIDGLVYVPGGPKAMRAREFAEVEIVSADAYDLKARLAPAASNGAKKPAAGSVFDDLAELASLG